MNRPGIFGDGDEELPQHGIFQPIKAQQWNLCQY